MSNPISPLLGVTDPTVIERGMLSGPSRRPAESAAQQFEAILLRQLLGEAMKPLFNSEAGAKPPGQDVYQYLVTDVVAQSVAQGGGVGLAKMLLPQFTTNPSAEKPDTPS